MIARFSFATIFITAIWGVGVGSSQTALPLATPITGSATLCATIGPHIVAADENDDIRLQ
jgi:hypothetical protein